MKILADSNLLIDATFNSPKTTIAQQALALSSQVASCVAWRYEAAQYFGRKARLKHLTTDQAVAAFEAASQLVDVELPMVGANAIRLSVKHSLSSYDAFFAYHAIDLNCPLVTSDERLVRALPDVAVTPSMFVDSLLLP